MRIKVFSSVDEHAGRPPTYEVVDAECKLRVRVWHGGHWYEIAPDQQNKLTIRAVGGGQLILKPRASNDVRLDVEGPP